LIYNSRDIDCVPSQAKKNVKTIDVVGLFKTTTIIVERENNTKNRRRDHLFFECSFSMAVWSSFASKFFVNPPSSLRDVASWIQSRPVIASQPRPPNATITKLILQASISAIWKERNSRIFSVASCSIPVIRKSIDRSLRDRLLSFPAPSSSAPFLLAVYFGCIPFV